MLVLGCWAVGLRNNQFCKVLVVLIWLGISICSFFRQVVKQLSMPLQLLICLKSCLERESDRGAGQAQVEEINMARKWVMRAVFLTSQRLNSQ